jgi:eukaryotic-like serine/threonine-protein kinase
MGSGSSASNELPTPSSTSGPRFNNEPEGQSFDRPTLRVGRYRILSELGRGGMSNVYLAVARGPGGVNKLVVLKALLPDLSTEPYALAMFLDEARLAAQLNHPNVVQTYEVGTEGDRHVIVMEYLEGQSLSATVKRAQKAGVSLPLALHLRVVINALEGLHYAHELRAYDGAPLELVHRDVSPQNVFVTYDGQVKVLDFGIAKATSSSTHTATGVVKGKIAYMAPEQIIGDAVDRRADLYSVGSVLWGIAAGAKLWKDTPDVHIMRRVINGEVPSPQSVNPGCDDELTRIVMKALATDPNVRHQTALELQQELEQYVDRLGPAVKQKEIGRYVSELFADTRAELKALVERQLTLIQGDESSASLETVSALIPGSTSITSRSSSFQSTAVAPLVQPARRGGRFLVTLVLLGLIGGGGYLWWKRTLEPAPAVGQVAAKPVVPVQPAAAPEPAAPARVSMTFHASPSDAKLFLDDEQLPTNPTTKLLPVDGKTHVFRARAAGHAEASSEFSPTEDTTLKLSLDPDSEEADHDARPGGARTVKRGNVRPWRAPNPSAPSAPSVPAPVNSKPNCDSPFFLDKDGIRRMRPECI